MGNINKNKINPLMNIKLNIRLKLTIFNNLKYIFMMYYLVNAY